MTATKRFLDLLTPRDRRTALAMLGLLLVGMVLEMMGIGLVIPAFSLMSGGGLAARFPPLAPWLQRPGFPTGGRLVIIAMLVLAGVTAIKTVFLAFLAWRQARFVYGLQSTLSQRLFAGYLRQPYTFHLQRNSAQLIRNAIGHVADITNLVQQGLILLTELFVLFGVTALLIVVEPLGALIVVATLSAAGYAFQSVTRRHILQWGRAHHLHEGMRIQHLQQGLGGAKDVLLLGRETDFLKQYKVHSEGAARSAENMSALQALPRLWLELLAVCGLAVLVAVMVAQGKPLAALLPTVGLFAAAAFRFMPSVNRVLFSLQSVRYYWPALETVSNELRSLRRPSGEIVGAPLRLSHALTIEGVSYRYPSNDVLVLDAVNLVIPRGRSVGFVGASGAGKTTLVDIILGLLTPSEGSVFVDGVDIQGNLRGWQDNIGYVPQVIYLTDDTLRRNIAFGLADDQIDDDAVSLAISAAHLEAFVNELPAGLETVVGERGVRLSGGQRQRIGIARALYHDPEVLVLDEATSSLDTSTESGVMDAVRSLRGVKTLLIVAHRLSTVEQCDHLYRFERGRVVQEGDPALVLGSGHVA